MSDSFRVPRQPISRFISPRVAYLHVLRLRILEYVILVNIIHLYINSKSFVDIQDLYRLFMPFKYVAHTS